MENEVQTQVFDYTELDVLTADFLRRKESNMREIVSNAIAAIGKELYEAQTELAGKNQYDGLFLKWLAHIGYPVASAYEVMAVYKERFRISEEQIPNFDKLPITLMKTIAKPSAESTEAKVQAKAEVLDGSIATLKEYRERIAELEAQALRVESARRQADERAELAEQKAQQYEQLFGEQAMYDAGTSKVTNGDAITYAVYSFQEDVRSLVEKYSHLTHFRREFDEMIDEGRDEYLKAVETAKQFIGSIERMLTTKDAIIIEQ